MSGWSEHLKLLLLAGGLFFCWVNVDIIIEGVYDPSYRLFPRNASFFSVHKHPHFDFRLPLLFQDLNSFLLLMF